MSTIYLHPTFDDLCERLCEAVRILGIHTPEGRVKPMLEPLPPGSLVNAVLACGASAMASAVLVVQAPASGLNETIASRAQRERFLNSVSEIRRLMPTTTMVVVVAATDWKMAVSLGELGVRDVVLEEDEGSAAALSVRLRKVIAQPLVEDFLAALPREVPPRVRLFLSQYLEEVSAGILRPAEKLREGGCGEFRAIRSELRSLGLDPLDIWCERICVYAVVRGCEEEGVSFRQMVSRVGFTDLAAFTELCRRETGTDAVPRIQGGGAWRGVLRAMAERWEQGRAARTPIYPENSTSDDEPKAEAFIRLRRATEKRAMGIARARMDADEARDVVAEVYEAIYRLGEVEWEGLSESYVLRAVSNRSINRVRDRRRHPLTIPLEQVHLESSGPKPDAAIHANRVENAVGAALKRLSSRRALAWWLVDWRGWRPNEVADLLGCSDRALWNLRSRAREALAHQLEEHQKEHGRRRARDAS